MKLQSIHALIEVLAVDSPQVNLIWGVCDGSRENMKLNSSYPQDSREWELYKECIKRKVCSLMQPSRHREHLSILSVDEEELSPLLWLESPDRQYKKSLFVAMPLSLGNMKSFLSDFFWFESAMSKSSEISCLTDRNGRIFRMSRRGRELLGISEKEAEGEELDHYLVSPSDIASLEKLCRHSDGVEIYMKTAGGREVLCIGSAVPFTNKRGDVLYYYFSAADVSRQMRLFSHSVRDNLELSDKNDILLRSQTALLKTEKLASIGLLGSGLAHEINNPLSFIVNDISLLGEYMNNFLSFIDGVMGTGETGDDREELYKRHDIAYCAKEVPEMLGEMRSGVDRIAHLVHSLKSFSGVDKSGEWGYFNLNTTLEEMLLISRNEYKYDIDVDFRGGEIPLVYCTVKEINQAFLALFMNSIQAVRESLAALSEEKRGLITIETRRGEGDTVEVVFSDDGIPFPEGKEKRYTDPFFSAWGKGEHSGMGLAVVNDIISYKHRGDVKIQRDGDKSVTLILPVSVSQIEE